jgi:hypothetical protein
MADQHTRDDGERDRVGDRRQGDRRRGDRRTPAPPWLRPWAFVGYGVAGALVVVLLIATLGEEEEAAEAGGVEVTTAAAPPAVDPGAPAAARAPVRDAYSVGEFERLLAEGEAVVGQRVRATLLCEPTGQVAVRDVDRVTRSVAELADAQRRVPAAQCKWGTDAGAPDFLLLVPPELAERFAAAPEVEQNFVRRRRVHAEVEWLGRRDALALRNAGVLRRVLTE